MSGVLINPFIFQATEDQSLFYLQNYRPNSQTLLLTLKFISSFFVEPFVSGGFSKAPEDQGDL